MKRGKEEKIKKAEEESITRENRKKDEKIKIKYVKKIEELEKKMKRLLKRGKEEKKKKEEVESNTNKNNKKKYAENRKKYKINFKQNKTKE